MSDAWEQETERLRGLLSDDERSVFDALYADTWTEPKPEYGPDWHHRLARWQAIHAARIAVAALEGKPEGAER